MKKVLIFILPFIFSGCLYVNERGIDTQYYNTCKEYYDSMGVYHKECDKNLIEFKDVKEGTKKVIDTAVKTVQDGYETVKQEVQ